MKQQDQVESTDRMTEESWKGHWRILAAGRKMSPALYISWFYHCRLSEYSLESFIEKNAMLLYISVGGFDVIQFDRRAAETTRGFPLWWYTSTSSLESVYKDAACCPDVNDHMINANESKWNFPQQSICSQGNAIRAIFNWNFLLHFILFRLEKFSGNWSWCRRI